MDSRDQRNVKDVQVDRDRQFAEIENLFTWYDEIIDNYEAAFWVHYHILCKTIDIWITEVKKNSFLARVTYFVNTEYMSMVLCELLLTAEILFKAELIRAGYSERLITHSLIKLLKIMISINDDRCRAIYNNFEKCKKFFYITDRDNSFVNVRYMDGRSTLNSSTATEIKKVVSVLDDVYCKYYDFNIERLLYIGMNVDCEILSEDEKRRLKRLNLL